MSLQLHNGLHLRLHLGLDLLLSNTLRGLRNRRVDRGRNGLRRLRRNLSRGGLGRVALRHRFALSMQRK